MSGLWPPVQTLRPSFENGKIKFGEDVFYVRGNSRCSLRSKSQKSRSEVQGHVNVNITAH